MIFVQARGLAKRKNSQVTDAKIQGWGGISGTLGPHPFCCVTALYPSEVS